MKRGPKPKKFTTEEIIDTYDAFLREPTLRRVAERIKIHHDTLEIWLKDSKEIQTAQRLALERRELKKSFNEYIFRRLSPEAKRVWEEIRFWSEHESSYERINSILEGHPIRLKQELWIHAMINHCWNPSEACHMTCTTMKEFQQWKENDLDFRQLIEEINYHKKNWYASALDNLVAAGSEKAVIFVNKTINSDRGYGEKIQLEHSGQIEAKNGDYVIDDLELDIDTRRKVLDAIRKKKDSQRIIEMKPANVLAEIAA